MTKRTSVVATLLLLATTILAALIPIDSKSMVWCNYEKKRYSVILGEKAEYDAIEEYQNGDIFGGTCLPPNESFRLYII